MRADCSRIIRHLFNAVPVIAFRLVRKKVYIEMAAVSGSRSPRMTEMLGFGRGVNIGGGGQSLFLPHRRGMG